MGIIHNIDYKLYSEANGIMHKGILRITLELLDGSKSTCLHVIIHIHPRMNTRDHIRTVPNTQAIAMQV